MDEKQWAFFNFCLWQNMMNSAGAFDVFVKIPTFHTHLKDLKGRKTTQNDFDTYPEIKKI